MIVLGVHGSADSEAHDASAALVIDGVLVAAAEQERFSRNKHAVGENPTDAIAFCLDHGGLTLSDVDALAVGWNEHGGRIHRVEGRRRETDAHWLDILPSSRFPDEFLPPTYYVRHHLAHIVAAHQLSGYESCACLCVDGQGESESVSLAHATPDGIEWIRSYDRIHSLGMFYEEAAHYVGLGYNNPGKFMGLASYGRPVLELPLTFDEEAGRFINELAGLAEGKSTSADLFASYRDHFIRSCYPFTQGSPETLMHYLDFAASAQHLVNEVMLGLARYLHQVTREPRLVVCGGVALNCSANREIDEAGPFKEVFIPPAANDASIAIGAAIEVCRIHGESRRSAPMRVATLGAARPQTWSPASLEELDLEFVALQDDELAERVARDLANDEMVAWYHGRAEFGPRALGARSLLANPTKRHSLVRVNHAKKREMWRPIACSILEEEYSTVFSDRESPLCRFMLKACKVRPGWWSRIPACVHIDGTCRPHTVSCQDFPVYHQVIRRFHRMTGVPLVINTSLNRAGEPIAQTPDDAVRVFRACPEIETLVIDDYYIRRR